MFFIYSCSLSFRELKNAFKKNQIQGAGGEIKISTKKNWVRILGQVVEPGKKYWVSMKIRHG